MGKGKVKILFLSDNDSRKEIVINELVKKFDEKFQVQYALSMVELEQSLHEYCPDVILYDYSLQTIKGCEALKLIYGLDLIIPFIVVTDVLQEELLSQCFVKGVWDYVVIERIQRLSLVFDNIDVKRKERIKLREQHLELLETKDRYQHLVEDIEDVLFEVDENFNFLYISPAIISFTGEAPEFYIGKNFGMLIYEEDIPMIRKCMGGAQPIEQKKTYRINGKNDDYLWVQSYSKPIIKNGKLVGTRGIIVDISEQKRAEEALIKAKERAEESDRLKSAFLANVSHEIRTPMNGMLGFAELLQTPDLPEEDYNSYIGVIRECGDRILTLINNIVTISKIESGAIDKKIVTFNLYRKLRFLQQLFEPQVEEKNIELAIICEEIKNKEITSDEEKIIGIITILVKNAIKFTTEGSVKLCAKVIDNNLEINVIDTGVGIDPKMHSVIFDRFRQVEVGYNRTFEGVGLGLSIVKAYCDILGGTICIDSDLGKGTHFIVSIPLES
ncbi:PAS domain S-box protein [Prolixibacteraceae bacterium JC049]|nr:PAS domain S-box protein [Prolixibacteraceae bacterium JC049]